MDRQIHCSKCGGSMSEGFVMELPVGRQAVTTWVEGKIERSAWTGIQYKNRRRHPLTTYCCQKCGYLESFADLTAREKS